MAKARLPLIKLACTYGLTALGAGPLSLLPLEVVSILLNRFVSEDVLNKIGELSGDILGELAGESVSELLKSFSRTPSQDLRKLYLMALKDALEDEREHLRRSYGEKAPLSEGKLLPGDQEQLFARWFEKINEALEDEIERDLLFLGDGPVLTQITGTKTDDEYQELWWGFLKKIFERWDDGKPLLEDLSELMCAGLPDRIADSLNRLLSDERYEQALNKYQADFLNLILRGVSELKKQADRHEQKTDFSNEKLNVIIELLLEQRGKVSAQIYGKPSFPIHRIARPSIPHFTGRDGLLEEIHKTLNEGGAAALTAIHGLGGVGKTQLAAEFAHKHKEDYQIIWWVTAENAATLAADFSALATSLRLPEKDAQETAVIVEAVKRALNNHADWLLIFDNAPNAVTVRDYLPPNRKGHVLVTSRDPNWGGLARKLEVPKLAPDDAKKFLLERTGQEDAEAAAQLAEELGCLPLALEQAGAYIEAAGETMAGYLRLFLNRRQELWAGDKPPVDYPDTVAETWLISFEAAEEECSDSAGLMRLCAYFAPDDIPLRMLGDGAEHLPEELAACIGDELAFNRAIAALRRYSLIEKRDDSLWVHRLVQAVTRDRLTEDERKTWGEAAVRVVNDAFPFDSEDVRTWPECAKLLPHALASAEQGEALNVAVEATGRLLNQTGMYYKGRAQYAEAKQCYERALKLFEMHLGENHPNVATLVNNLGGVLKAQGNLAEAKQCFERALRIFTAFLGEDHPYTVGVRDNLKSLG